MSAAYVAIAVAALAVVLAVVWFRGSANRAKRLTPLAGLAFGFVIAGIVWPPDAPTSLVPTGRGRSGWREDR